MKRSGDTRILVGLFVLLLVGSLFVAAPERKTESKAPTSYNADPAGNKAFYMLLGRLGYKVSRLRKPYTDMPGDARLLIVVEPGKHEGVGRDISDKEHGAIGRWLEGGGTALVFADKPGDLPESLLDPRLLSLGRMYIFDSGEVITNKAMRKPGNAESLVNVVASHASKNGLIVFDEYHHGLGETKSENPVTSRQVIVSIIVLVIAGLLLGYSRGRRFGAVRNLPGGDSVRPGFEYIESVGRLYRRAGATDLAAEILCDSFKRELCLKLALPADAHTGVILRRMEEDIEPDICKRTGSLISRCERSEAGDKPSDSELLDIALEIRNLEKELRIGPVDG